MPWVSSDSGNKRPWKSHLCVISTLILVLLVIDQGECGGLAPSSDASARPKRAFHRNCSSTSQVTSTPAPKVKVVVKPIPKPGSKEPHHPVGLNEIGGKETQEAGTYRTEETGERKDLEPCHDPGPEITVTLTDNLDSWKTKVIIACTIAAAIEILIIIVIIAYWREIRWTMRKIACPCDERPSRHGDHEAMERAEPARIRVPPPERRDLLRDADMEDSDVMGVGGSGQAQTFRHPRRSRTQEALDDVIDDVTDDLTTRV